MSYQFNKCELQAREYDFEISRSGPLCLESEIYIRDYLNIFSDVDNAHTIDYCPDSEYCFAHRYGQLDFYQWRPIKQEVTRPFLDIPKWQNASFSEHLKWHSEEKPNFVFQPFNQYIVP